MSRTYTYDSKGNRTTGQDETSRSLGTTTFDTTYQLFPESYQNAAGETVSTAWDKACGVPTQITDANGQVTTSQYDSLCRLTRTDLPPAVGGFEIRSYLDLGDPDLQRTRVETPPATGSSGNDWAETYFDGFGRTYRTEKRGPSASQTIFTESDLQRAGRGPPSTQPYYENGASPVTDGIPVRRPRSSHPSRASRRPLRCRRRMAFGRVRSRTRTANRPSVAWTRMAG